ncbi:hypothetical protein BDY24DRAFT_414088 [Mrakia frigida]|uniref:uncharacterized protein n=1 Tax=Mrakia frigida TaxID=29902 RepID=UPI003FCC2137
MEAGPSSFSSSSSSTRNPLTRTLTTFYPVTNEEASSQAFNDQEDATRAQHESTGKNLVGRLVSQQAGERIWRDVMVWEGQMGKGKGRMVVDREEEEGKECLVSSNKERAQSRFQASSTSTLLLPNTPSSPTFKAYIPRLLLPPTRGDLQWIPDVPVLEWGEPPTVEEELPSQEEEEEKGGWWFENEGRLSVCSLLGTEGGSLVQARKELKKKERKIEKERIQKETKSWKGDWTMMGKCVELTPQPHFSPFLYPTSNTSALPPLSSITAPPHPFTPLPLPISSPPFPPLKPGLQRGRWIIPINGLILGFPPSYPPLSSARLVNDQVRIKDAEQKLRKRMLAPSNSTTTNVKPSTLYWTPTLLRSFHRTLVKLQARNVLGPVSFRLQRSNLVKPSRAQSSSASVEPEGGREEIRVGDHWVVYVDLAYALRIRHVLGNADIRMVEGSEEQEDRPHVLKRARLMLLDEVGNVLCFS